MLPPFYVVLVLTLANALSISSTISKPFDNKTMNDPNDNPLAEINLQVALPSTAAEWVYFDCDEGGKIVTQPHQTHKWFVPNNKVEFCRAHWVSNNLKASFNAFDAQSDNNHVVYWLVKKDGLFHSWDNASWEKKATWQPWRF